LLTRSLYRAARFAWRFKNPAAVAWARLFGRGPTLMLWDRRTGARCRARREAHSIFTEVFHNGEYDVPGLTLGPGDVVLDVGAHQGFFACYAALKGARVHAYEPDPDNYALLLENVARNGLGVSVEAHNTAVGAATGRVQLYGLDAMGGGMNSTSDAYARVTGHRVREARDVPCLSVADMLAPFAEGRIALFKLDVEGAELEILRALPAAAAASIDSFALEYHEPMAPLSALAEVILGWGTHQLSLAEDLETGPRRILRAVATRCFTG
jgi:FkbM family methyltransferase